MSVSCNRLKVKGLIYKEIVMVDKRWFGNDIRLPYSYFKIGLLLLASLAFTVLCILILIDDNGMVSVRYASKIFNKTFAIIGILFLVLLV